MQIRSSRQHSLDIMWHFFYSGAVETVRCLTKFVWNLCRKAEPHVEGTGFLEAAFWTAGVLAVVQTPNAKKIKKTEIYRDLTSLDHCIGKHVVPLRHVNIMLKI